MSLSFLPLKIMLHTVSPWIENTMAIQASLEIPNEESDWSTQVRGAAGTHSEQSRVLVAWVLVAG